MLASFSAGKEDPPAMRFERTPDVEIHFPPLPQTVVRVTELLEEADGQPDVQALAEVVNQDPIVASAVLRRINSAYYGMRRRISQVEKAVFLLGFLEVSNLVMTAAMLQLRDIMDTDQQIAIFKKITRNSIGAAFLMRRMIDQLEQPANAMGYTVGLLHNVGRLVLLYNRPDDYEALWYGDGGPTPPDPLAEKRIFGVDYGELGAMATENWQLPRTISEVLRSQLSHAMIAEEHRELRTLTLLLATCSAAARIGLTVPDNDFHPPDALHMLAQALERSSEDIEALIVEELPEMRSFIESMSLNGDGDGDGEGDA